MSLLNYFHKNKTDKSTAEAQPVVNSDQETINIDESDADTSSKQKRSFNTKWANEFPWLVKLSEKEAKCIVCERNKSDRKNEWATSKTMTDWKKDTLQKHALSMKHKQNRLIPSMHDDLVKSVRVANQKASCQTVGLMINVLSAIQNEMSIQKIELLHTVADIHVERALSSLVKKNLVSKADCSINAIKLSNKHRSSYSTYKIINALNKSVMLDEALSFKKSIAICLHVDESTDVSSSKILLIYLTICNPENLINGERFGTALEIEKCDADSIASTISQWVDTTGLKKNNIFMFTSDGAAVMTGKNNGVAKKLRDNFGFSHLVDYHCICHRENLAMKDSYKVTQMNN